MKQYNFLAYFFSVSISVLILFLTFVFCCNSMNVEMDSGYLERKYIIPAHYILTRDYGRVHVAQEFVVVLSRGDKQKAFIVKESVYNAAELDTLIEP